MNGLHYYIIDVETNGLDSKTHEINEISIIRVSDKVQFFELVKTEHPERSSRDALMIIGKKISDLSKGISKLEVVEKINKFLDSDGVQPANRCFIAHNASFDRRFIHALYESVDQEFKSSLWLDTMALTKAYAKKNNILKPKVNLQAACDLVGIKKISGAHAAKIDTRNTFFLYKNLVEDKKIDHLPLIKTQHHSYNQSEYYEEIDESIFD